MAGHSKWANIKHRKGKADALKGKIFSRLMKEIIVAVKAGGPDPRANAKLRLALEKAKAANLPKDSIERNIKKAASSDQANYDEILYELYGHGGVGILCEILTDNKNRIASDIRIATNKKGGTVATPGAVSYLFDRKGIIQIPKKGIDPDALFLAISENGADDLIDDAEDIYVVLTPPESLYSVKEALEALGYACLEATLEMIPKTSIACDEEAAAKNLALIEYLEAIDDIDSLFHNMEM